MAIGIGFRASGLYRFRVVGGPGLFFSCRYSPEPPNRYSVQEIWTAGSQFLNVAGFRDWCEGCIVLVLPSSRQKFERRTPHPLQGQMCISRCDKS